MPKQRSKKKRRVSRLRRARVADEFDPRAYFMSMPVEPPKPKEPEADFDARDYFLNGGGEG
jgi:hypothetical protein